MAYNYTTLVEALSIESKIPATDASFAAALPTFIRQGEGLIYRDIPFLSTIVTDTSGTLPANTRQFTLPREFKVLHSINRVDGNERPPLIKISREAMDMLWTRTISESASDVPRNWAPLTDQVVLFGPVAGASVQLVCIGEVTPEPISADNDETWVSLNLPDLLLAACMIGVTGYMRNWGSQADDPKMAVSWREVYERLLGPAKSDEMRRKFNA